MLRVSSRTLSIIFLLSLCCFACKEKQPTSLSVVSSFVYAYTSGVITKTTPVRVKFTQDVVTSDKIGTEVPSKIFKTTPAADSRAVWEDARTILLQPNQAFQSGTTYRGAVTLSQLFDEANGAASQFLFDFTIKPLRFDVTVEGLKAKNNDLKQQELIGTVHTADQVADNLVQQSLQATQSGKNLPIRWENIGASRYRFVVENIQRSMDASSVSLNWDADPMGIEEQGNKAINVPALNDFKVISAQSVQGNDPHILIHFSDPILKSQEINGLVRISNYTDDIKYLIDGNQVRVYVPNDITGNRKVSVLAGIRNVNNTKMKNNSTWTVTIVRTEPALRLIGTGSIIPNSNGLIFPFEAVSLNAVDVEIFKIYDNNILQFLQTNELDGDYDLERVGNIILQEKINLKELVPDADLLTWTRYAFDLEKMIDKDPDAIYQIRVGFRPSYSQYGCNRAATGDDELTLMENPFDADEEVKSIWGDYYGIEGHYQGYEWEHRDNPCFPAYFNYNRFIKRNVIASDLGIIAKRGKNNSNLVAVADIKTTLPVPGVNLSFYDYQQQLLKSITTDSDGIARLDLDKPAFAVVATKGDQKGYLKMQDGRSLSLSRFDVSGAVVQKGLKGFIYGERGVWRPGDSIYLNFILEDKTQKLPANHPINIEIVNPQGQIFRRWTTSDNVNNVYPMATATPKDAPTGNWLARVKVGGAQYTKRLKIETVKPNRLKIDLDFGREVLQASNQNLSGNLQVNWLHGAPAQNVNVIVEAQVKPVNTTFPKYKDFEFDDPSRKYAPEPMVLFDEPVNSDGEATVNVKLTSKNVAPGMLQCNFQTRAFEKGGDFSTDNFSIKYSPYEAYAGVQIRENKYGQKRLNVGKGGNIEFIAVDENGNPLSNRNLKVGLYRVNWRWWWDSGRDNISKYNSASHYGALQSGNLRTNSKGETDWSVNIDKWGRYLVRVCDAESGHCSGDFFYAGYPWYDNDDDNAQNRKAASMLVFSSDKQTYNVGDQIELNIPSSEEGRALISIESGSQVLETYWTDLKAGETSFRFYATEEMTPTVYANVSLLQPHAQVKNDLPIRMYGVIPISVENKNTRLEPTLNMPKVLEPEQTVTVKVSEKTGRPMTYTIAMVDEGLLDLTRFKTPSPWNSFYAREALGVKTWDVYDQVLGAQSGLMDRILAIGGDGAAETEKTADQANRFQPVVKHLGPFYLNRGTATHTITIPNYIGSVRTMVVAANDGAYGSTEVTTPVRKPLMTLATLPRVLSPTENLSLPVTVFAMEDKIKNVQVTVEETSGLVSIAGTKTQNVTFDKPGEKLVYFDLIVTPNVGVADFKVIVSGNGESATHEIQMPISNPNPYVNDVQEKVIQPSQKWQTAFSSVGMLGTNTGTLEVSNIPPIDLGKRLHYLLRYPHGCIEQTTSAAFPQLYVSKLMEVEEAQKRQLTEHITTAINRLTKFQTTNGAFGYWPGDADASPWGTNYAGHFMLEAQALGYILPPRMLNNWIAYQKRVANNWVKGDNRYDNELTQAYRLYTLALAGEAQMGAMNRMREDKTISEQAKWRLATAYAQTGRVEVAQSIITGLPTQIKDYRELSYTYGSGLRDEAMILETLVQMKDWERAGKVAINLSKKLSANRWYSTQTVAYSLLAIGKMVGNTAVGKSYNFTYQIGNQASENVGSTAPIINIDIPVDGNPNKNVLITNNSGGILYATLVINGQPLIGQETAASNDLKMDVNYYTIDGESLDPARIPQGTDFIAQVTLTNPGSRGITYREMALTQVFPSGWEILNTRMTNIDRFKDMNKPTYQDIRDDRVYSYFDIQRKKSVTFAIQLNAAYQGKYYLPAVSCEAMYDNTIYARVPGEWVEVVGVNSF